jgi:alpha-galactosidase/6-phospho-beta-glucosidase family protein
MWAKREGLIPPDYEMHRNEVDVIAAGLNHQTWFIKVEWSGHNMIPLLAELFEQHPEYSQTEKVRIDVLKRFGYYSTESNGHLSEYVPWYPAVDRSLELDQRRNGWLPARLYRGSQLVRHRFSAVAGRRTDEDPARQTQRGTRFLYHRGPGNRACVSWTLQHRQSRPHH